MFIVHGMWASFFYRLKISCHLDLQFIHGRPPDTSCTLGQELYNQIRSLELASVRLSGWDWQTVGRLDAHVLLPATVNLEKASSHFCLSD